MKMETCSQTKLTLDETTQRAALWHPLTIIIIIIIIIILKRPTRSVKQGFKTTNEHKFFAYNL